MRVVIKRSLLVCCASFLLTVVAFASTQSESEQGNQVELSIVDTGARTEVLEPVFPAAVCKKPLYLTFDTGHMEIAPFVEEVLQRQQVRATFFLANERTRTGGGSLDDVWAPWWKKLSEQGHQFASHTFDHVYWRADLPDGTFRMRASAGPLEGKTQVWTAQDYCLELKRPVDRFREMTGQGMLPLFRAAGGRTSPALLKAAQECGFTHVGWSPAGFLGDELSSEKYPNKLLLDQALRNIRSGEPLIQGLKGKGFCFATLDTHPSYQSLSKLPGLKQ
jgi:peptidoglycan/xylan/chitin deacetylase (PgdA/CDA1 family)